MEIIVTHEMTDFDAFAAAVAAQKLHPKAVIVLGRHLDGNLRAFLKLHRDRFPTLGYSEIELSAVNHLILVDVRREARLGELDPLIARVHAGDPELTVTVYDHHAPAPDDLPARAAIVERVGSATTLLVERLRARRISIDSVDATLFAIGIHEDTGSLTYAATTARDAEAVAWLLGKGANPRVLNRYLKSGLGREQREVLARILDALRHEPVGVLELGVAIVPLKRQVADLGEVVSRVAELDESVAVFVLFPIGNRRVQIIARSRTPLVDVGQALRAIGGGGHAQASSALVHVSDAERIRQQILTGLRAQPQLAVAVRDLMTVPARVVRADQSISELERALCSWRSTGAPVVSGAELVGVISRRDVARARSEGQLEAPVSHYMCREPLTAAPGEPIERAMERMISADVGRLPVLHDGKLVGILTRSDVIRALYRESQAPVDGR